MGDPKLIMPPPCEHTSPTRATYGVRKTHTRHEINDCGPTTPPPVGTAVAAIQTDTARRHRTSPQHPLRIKYDVYTVHMTGPQRGNRINGVGRELHVV